MSEGANACIQLKSSISDYIHRLDELDNKQSIYAARLTYEPCRLIKTELDKHTSSGCDCRPLHKLLNAGPFTHIEIPIDIPKLLATKFNVNSVDKGGWTCLHVAVSRRHYNIIRWLVQDMAADPNRCNVPETGIPGARQTPITYLAKHSQVPLDVFDVLRTKKNLNDNTLGPLPLHVALRHGHGDYALHLIRLGARVDQVDSSGKLPVEYFEMNKHGAEYSDELFCKLIPAKGLDVLTCVGRVFSANQYEHADKVLERLLERLPHFHNEISVEITASRAGSGHELRTAISIDKREIADFGTLCTPYLMSLLLLLLDCDIQSNPVIEISLFIEVLFDEHHVDAIHALWSHRANTSRLRSLFKLCVKQIRRHMISLSEESFQSLPLPPAILHRLMYHDIAKTVCEAYRAYPNYVPRLRKDCV